MATQPLYGTVTDNQGYCRHSSSQRGRVDELDFWLNSIFGTVMRIGARYRDAPTVHIERRGKSLTQYRELKAAAMAEADRQRRVVIDLNLEQNERFEFSINGITLPRELLKNIVQLGEIRFERQLAAVVALRDAMQPVKTA
jgi:hypothetical protein